ncbi:MAG: deoxynucleoside kinase [Bacteroidetes bacterium]|nr:deoxynucleoside kinase [Bacteroidota bacterium]
MNHLTDANSESRGAAEPEIALRDELQYIVVEGVIGAGKTTLSRILADRFSGRLVTEQFEENPFLERFYEDRERWAFQTQMSFLASRFKQQNSLLGPDLFHRVMVSDYLFEKDRLFALLNLKGDELQLYDSLFAMMRSTVKVPDLIVYLQSSTDRLMHNIRQRGRAYEATMDREYIAALNEVYNNFFFTYTRSPVLIINADKIDFVKNRSELDEIVRQIASSNHPGTVYFNPTPVGTLFG